MVGEDGHVTVMDFGLAQFADRSRLTRDGTTLGTVLDMSPEQSEGSGTDHHTDIWSLGVVLYEMVSGQPPFKGDYDLAVTYSILNENPEPLTGLRTGVPVELDRIVSRALAKDRDGRTLVFFRYGSGVKADLHLLDLDEDLNPRGEPRRRTFMEQLTLATAQSFTSDGRDIVFSAGPMMANSSLWRVPVSGTASPERLPFGEVGVWPFVSRQGNRLAYTRRDMNVNHYCPVKSRIESAG